MIILMKLSNKKKPALALSGGGFKAAAFHIGVCLALKEKGFRFAGGTHEEVAQNFPDNSMTFKTYIGSSAGSNISAYLASGYSIEAIIQAFVKDFDSNQTQLQKDPIKKPLITMRYRDIFSLNVDAGSPSRLIKGFFKEKPTILGTIEAFVKRSFQINGVFTTDALEKYFRTEVLSDNDFSKLGVNLYIIATQLNHSRKVIFGSYEKVFKEKHVKYANYATISQAIAASTALPPAFSPYEIINNKGKKIHFFDGEIRDTLSTHVADDNGCDLVIASYSIQPYHYNKSVGSLHQYGIPLIVNQALYQLVQQKIDTHRKHRSEVKNIINSVHHYLSQINLKKEEKEKVMQIILEQTEFRPNVEYIYIHPSPEDHEMFFADHFSLKPAILQRITKIGFKSAMKILRKYS